MRPVWLSVIVPSPLSTKRVAVVSAALSPPQPPERITAPRSIARSRDHRPALTPRRNRTRTKASNPNSVHQPPRLWLALRAIEQLPPPLLAVEVRVAVDVGRIFVGVSVGVSVRNGGSVTLAAGVAGVGVKEEVGVLVGSRVGDAVPVAVDAGLALGLAGGVGVKE